MSLEELLRASTVRVEGPRPGAGFFLAPGIVITCAHVTGEMEDLEVVWGPDDSRVGAHVEKRLTDRGRPIPDLAADYPDIAILRVPLEGHPCVAIDEDEPKHMDTFQTYGFPDEGGSVILTPATLTYRGTKGQDPTEFIDLAADRIKPGMSGGPLLSLRSKAVCGVLVATRGPSSPEGGFAVSWASIRDGLMEELAANRAFHAGDRSWGAAARPEGRRVRFRLPVVAKHFSGRGPELGLLRQSLERDGRVAITGLGGVGKSQLAGRYVQDYADEYELVAWIRAEDGGIADLADLAVELGDEVDGISPADRARRAVDRLASSDTRWLLILDNVATPDQLATCCPTTNGHVVVTSRNRALGDVLGSFGLDAFDPDTGADYLVGRTGRPEERQAALRLSEALGGLPLALAHAGAYCSSGTSLDEYLELLSELPSAEIFDESPEAFYSATVTSTWQVSIAAAGERAELAPSVLSMASYLAPDKIPLALFSVLLPADAGARERKGLRDAFNALHGLSLVEIGRTTLTVHRLLQKTVRDAEIEPAGADAAMVALHGAFPAESDLPARWPECEELYAHAMALLETVPPGRERAAVVEVAYRLSVYLVRVRDGRRALHTATAVLAYAEGSLDPDDPLMTGVRRNVATALWVAGRPSEAIVIEQELLADAKRRFGPEHETALVARHNLASSYQSAGRFDEAIAEFEVALEVSERVHGSDHPSTTATRAGLGNTYGYVGRYDEAIALVSRAVDDLVAKRGPRDYSALKAQASLGGLKYSAGRAEESIDLLEPTLAATVEVFGSEHPDTQIVRALLADAHGALGRTDQAIQLRTDALAVVERVLGPEHPDALKMRNNLAGSYEAAERIDEAVELREQVVAAADVTLGPEHPASLTYRGNLAVLLAVSGRRDEAVALLKQVVDGLRRVRGPDHPQTTAARARLDELSGA